MELFLREAKDVVRGFSSILLLALPVYRWSPSSSLMSDKVGSGLFTGNSPNNESPVAAELFYF